MWNVGRVVLQVAVLCDNDLAAAGIKSGLHGRRLSIVANQIDATDAVGCILRIENRLRRPVGGAVIDQNDFMVAAECGHDLADTGDQGRH